MNKTTLPHPIAVIALPGYNRDRLTVGRNRFPDMLTTPAIRSETRPSAFPDLIRETLLAQLHFPAPRTGDLVSVLELPPRTAGRNKGRTPLPSRRCRKRSAAEVKHYGPKSGTAPYRHLISAPPALFAARIGPAPGRKTWSQPSLDLRRVRRRQGFQPLLSAPAGTQRLAAHPKAVQ